MREVTVHPRTFVHKYLCTLICPVLAFMYILYIVPGSGNLYILYRRKHTCATFYGFDWGPKGPLLCCPAGHFTPDSSQEQERMVPLRTQGPHMLKFLVNIYPRPSVASNPQSQSRRLLSSCIVLLVLAYF